MNNSYVGLGDGSWLQDMFVSEYTQVSTLWSKNWANVIDGAKYRWVIEEAQYQAGSIDQVDGQFYFWQNRVKGWSSDKRFRFRTTEYPEKYGDIYQNQVSNGAQPGSYEYFDTLYVDDSWHRILICSQAQWESCTDPEIQIPIAWSDSSLKFATRMNGLQSKGGGGLYLYVVNNEGEVNAQGFALCPRCPSTVENLLFEPINKN
ncbi:hypothetical protein [Teredinibacter haidensis]|uniref:hypothetical protein n=1 Tax=Teredinibacter haidensis TaxID=2731755 RepID=UPI0009490B37|nr:hypothetical protein [Teredinibacter haidensis]